MPPRPLITSAGVLCAALLLTTPPCSASTATKTATTARIARIEQGLRAPVTVAGDEGWHLEDRMQHYGVPGVAIAVIENDEIAWVRTYGVRDRETAAPVTRETLFQAGSVSKPVAAYGALKMVDEGKLSLSTDVNRTLSSWKLPGNEFTREEHVTLTHLLSHTGGLTVHGFPGYAVGEAVPSVVQVLDGSGPANTPPVRVNQRPGEGYRYSGGGYTIAQLMMTDAAGQTFAELMAARVLKPLGMKRSTFQQPLPAKRLKLAAAGYLPDKTAVEGKRHTYPEMAAAGLWTTADDLARFAIDVQRALRGKSKNLPRATGERMLDPVSEGYGLGFGLWERGDGRYFGHGGWDEGFCAQLTAHRERGYGVVVLINSNHPEFISELIQAVGMEYGWDGYRAYPDLEIPAVALERYVGRYRYNTEQAFSIERNGAQLFMHYSAGERQELKYIGDGRYIRRERDTPLAFTEDDGAVSFHFMLGDGGRQSHERMPDDERAPREVLIAEGYEQARAVYRSVLKNDPADPGISEGWLNGQGLAMLAGEFHEPAIGLLKINTELYPDSANTWDSLGYAYRELGDAENAVRYYKKALEIDPQFASALRALSQLQGR